MAAAAMTVVTPVAAAAGMMNSNQHINMIYNRYSGLKRAAQGGSHHHQHTLLLLLTQILLRKTVNC
jgi:hypothetical protein